MGKPCTLGSVAFLLAILSFTQAADVVVKCVLSQNTPVNDAMFRVKPKLSVAGAVFSLQETGGYVSLPDPRKGVLKLVKSLVGLTLGLDNTRRHSVVLVVTTSTGVTNVNVEFIILVERFADTLVADIVASIKTLVTDDNIFRAVTTKYPIYRKLHRILLRGTKRSNSLSKANCSFRRALALLIRKILLLLKLEAASTVIHLGPEGMLSPEKVNEVIAQTGCIDAIPEPTCPLNDVFRTIDGTCNNRENPTLGAAETGFGRFVAPRYFDVDGLDEPLGAGDQPNAPIVPIAFQVTQDYIIEQAVSQANRRGLQHMLMQWGQFIDHDMTLAPESEGGDRCEEIPCNGSEEDFIAPCFPILAIPSQVASRSNCIRFVRSAAVCQRKGNNLTPREQINVNTAYLDASMVYGSSETVQTALRDLTNDLGLLRVSNGNLLPIDNSALVAPNDLCLQFGSCFLAGDLRSNEQAALASIHTLFLREHNRIAKELKRINGHWDGERIYQEARKIVGALVQKITYEDWLPIIIGNRLRRYRGYNRNVDASIRNGFAAAAFRMGHSLIRPTFDYLNANFDPALPAPIPLVQMYFNNTLIQSLGMEGFLFGAAGNSSQEMDSEVAIGATQQLFERANRIGLDLAALNIQRGRDHGLPGYGTYVRECIKFGQRYPRGAENASSFDDLAGVIQNETVRNSLSAVYNDDPENVDLWPAGLAETALPGGILGPTFTCLLRDQFRRLRDGDRFFYRNRGVFTRRQRRAIRRTTLSSIMCENLIGIVSVSRNVFRDNFRPSCGRIPRLNLEFWRERVTSCDPNPCKNNGVCRFSYRRGLQCRCPSGFKKPFCD